MLCRQAEDRKELRNVKGRALVGMKTNRRGGKDWRVEDGGASGRFDVQAARAYRPGLMPVVDT